MTNSIRLVDGSTTVWLRPAAPAASDAIICQSSELALAGPRAVVQERVGRAGNSDLTSLYNGSTFRASLIVRDAGGITRHQTIDTLRAMLAAHKRPYLYVLRDGWTAERRALLRGDSITNPVEKLSVARMEVSLQFVVPAGVLEDPVQQLAVLRPTTVAVGISLPVSLPAAFTPGGLGTTVLVTSAGNVPTSPVLRLYGGFTEPVVANLTTGQAVELDGVSVAAGSYIEVDVAARTVLLNSDPAQNYYSRLAFATTSWWDLQPGPNLISMSTGSQDASCELDVLWRDQWA